MGTWMAARVIVAVAASTLLLAGCAETRQAPPSGVSDAELAEYHDYMGSRMWEFTGLPQSMRPEVVPQIVEVEEWSERMEGCGDTGAVANAAGLQAAAILEYRCRMSYQLASERLGLLNEAQLDYLYDYYQDTLVPCLRIRGVELPEILTRDEAVDIGRFGAFPWNPYNAMPDFVRGDVQDAALWQDCPAFPPDAVFDRFWER